MRWCVLAVALLSLPASGAVAQHDDGIEIRYGLGVGARSAVDAPSDYATAPIVALHNSTYWISEEGHGFGARFEVGFDLVDPSEPWRFAFAADLSYVYRFEVIEDLHASFGIGPSFWYADATLPSACAASECTPQELAVVDAFDAQHDAGVFGGVLTMSFDHRLEDAGEGPFLGATASVRIGAALADELATVRWAETFGVRFGVNLR